MYTYIILYIYRVYIYIYIYIYIHIPYSSRPCLTNDLGLGSMSVGLEPKMAETGPGLQVRAQKVLAQVVYFDASSALYLSWNGYFEVRKA